MWLKWNGIASFAATERRTALPYRGDEAFRPASRMREEGSGAVRATEWRNAAGQKTRAGAPRRIGGAPLKEAGRDQGRIGRPTRRLNESRRGQYFLGAGSASLGRADQHAGPTRAVGRPIRP